MSQIRLFSTLDISATGLAAQRARMNVIAQNIANAGSTRAGSGEPYRRQVVDLEAISPNGPQAPGGSATTAPGSASSQAPANGGNASEISNSSQDATNAADTGRSAPTPAGEATGATPLTTDRDREASLDTASAAPMPPRGVAPAAPGVAGGVRVAQIREDDADFQRIHDPSHPDADADGYVNLPNVNMVNEMVDMMLAARAYEANLAVMTASKDLLMRTLTIGKQ